MIWDMVMLSVYSALFLYMVCLKEDYCVIAFVLSHLFSCIKEKGQNFNKPAVSTSLIFPCGLLH